MFNVTYTLSYESFIASIFQIPYICCYLWNTLPENLRPEDLGLSFFKKIVEEIFTKNKIRDFDPDRPHVTWAKNHSLVKAAA